MRLSAIWKSFPSPNRFEVVDVTQGGAVSTWARSCLAEGHVPDLLLNNAALINRNALLWEIGADEFAPIIGVNILGVANMSQYFAPAMIAARRGASSISVPAGAGKRPP